MNRTTENVVALLFGAMLLIAAMVAPLEGDDATGTQTPTPTSTPAPTQTTTQTPVSSPTPLPTGEIFRYSSEEFENRTFTVPVDLTAPPMVVRYIVEPRLISRTPDSTRLSPSPDSWLVVRIFDSEGELVAENGYGLPAGEKGSFGQNEKGSLTVYASGRYTIVIRFNEVMADIVVTSGK